MVALEERTISIEKEYGRERIPLDRIVVDNSYQRDAAKVEYVKKLAARWDDRAAHVVTLSLRGDGFYYVIDGQRRVAAKRLKDGPFSDIEAMVWLDLTPEEEARLFRQLQERQQLTALDVFKARLTEGEASAISIRRIVSELGLDIARGHGSARNCITAVTSLDKVYTTHGPNRLRDVLRILKDAFGDDRKAYALHAIEGLALFLARYPNARHDRMIETLERMGASGMIARGFKLRDYVTAPGPSLWGQALRLEYNKGLRSGALPEWPEKNFDSEAMKRAAEARRKA